MSQTTARIVISPDGQQVRCLYADALLPVLQSLGEVRIQRASEVEWSRETGGWFVDLSRSGGPVVWLDPSTGQPFHERAAALAFEKDWLEQHNCPAANSAPPG